MNDDKYLNKEKIKSPELLKEVRGTISISDPSMTLKKGYDTHDTHNESIYWWVDNTIIPSSMNVYKRRKDICPEKDGRVYMKGMFNQTKKQNAAFIDSVNNNENIQATIKTKGKQNVKYLSEPLSSSSSATINDTNNKNSFY